MEGTSGGHLLQGDLTPGRLPSITKGFPAAPKTHFFPQRDLARLGKPPKAKAQRRTPHRPSTRGRPRAGPSPPPHPTPDREPRQPRSRTASVPPTPQREIPPGAGTAQGEEAERRGAPFQTHRHGGGAAGPAAGSQGGGAASAAGRLPQPHHARSLRRPPRAFPRAFFFFPFKLFLFFSFLSSPSHPKLPGRARPGPMAAGGLRPGRPLPAANGADGAGGEPQALP